MANGGSFASPILAKPRKTLQPRVSWRRDVPLPRRPPSHSERNRSPFAARSPVVTLAVSAPVVKFGTQVTLTRRRVEQANRRDGHARRRFRPGRRPSRWSRRCRRRAAARSRSTRHAAAQHDLPGPVEGQPKARSASRSSRRSSCRSSRDRAISTSTSRPASRSQGRFVYLQRFTLAHTWINVRRLHAGAAVRPDHGDEVRPLGDPAWARGRSGSTCRRPRCRRLHRFVERHAACRQAVATARERGLTCPRSPASSARHPS